MRDPSLDPFPSSDDVHHAMWEMLVPHDIDTFLAADRSMVEGDFVEESLLGFTGYLPNPMG